ncbi:MAG: polyprenyl synthetase family protein [Bacteroidetes bacterium]|nr:polyprenyl synthetase family protein [Bacteroidota bacterium]
MAVSIETIKSPIAAELKIFEEKFREAMKSSVPLLDRIMQYIVKRKGKQMRPIFVLLSSKLFGDINETSYRAAALVELLHTATLVHDDVVDDAYKRRGFFSVNALWKNKIAVLVGDYLLAKGLLLSLNNKDHEILRIMSEAVKQMSEGELLQIEKARKLDIKEDIYFDIIRKKTASLISSCCASGCASTNTDPEMIEKMGRFGEKVGITFQIKDDLMDMGDEDTGKAKGIDIQEKKLTLPLIYTLSQSDRSTKRRIINTIKNHSRNKEKVKEVIELIRDSGGIEYAAEAMTSYKNEALEILYTLPDNEARGALEQMVMFTTERKN